MLILIFQYLGMYAITFCKGKPSGRDLQALCHVFRMCLGTEAGQKGKGHKAQ